jgi:hypothetical protein
MISLPHNFLTVSYHHLYLRVCRDSEQHAADRDLRLSRFRGIRPARDVEALIKYSIHNLFLDMQRRQHKLQGYLFFVGLNEAHISGWDVSPLDRLDCTGYTRAQSGQEQHTAN